MISLVYGFLGHAKMILSQSEEGEYIPALHCNQISIEGLFSHIRMMGRDRTDLYGAGILQQNISNCLKSSNVYIQSKTYPLHNDKDQSKKQSTLNKNFCLKTLYDTYKY